MGLELGELQRLPRRLAGALREPLHYTDVRDMRAPRGPLARVVVRERRPGAWETVLILASFGFLLEFVWEFLQIPLYARMTQLPHWLGVISCGRAATGDALIVAIAWIAGALVQRDRRWVLAPRPGSTLAYVGSGVLITIAMELAATRWLGRWQYSELMPLVPGLQVGAAPLLQWIVLPPLTLWLARRHLIGALALRARRVPPAA